MVGKAEIWCFLVDGDREGDCGCSPGVCSCDRVGNRCLSCGWCSSDHACPQCQASRQCGGYSPCVHDATGIGNGQCSNVCIFGESLVCHGQHWGSLVDGDVKRNRGRAAGVDSRDGVAAGGLVGCWCSRDHPVAEAQSVRQCWRNRPGSDCLLYTSPSPRDLSTSRMPSSA